MELIWIRVNAPKYPKAVPWVELGHRLGVDLFNGTVGVIRVNGKIVTRDGIKLTLGEEPHASQLKALNAEFTGYQRDYSVVPFKPGETRDLEAEVDELKARLTAVEAKAIP